MLLLNIEYIPGKEIQALGLAKGSVVQSKHFGKDFMAGMKTLVGGEIESYTKMLTEARQIATKRMVDDAEAMGADAIVGVRYTSFGWLIGYVVFSSVIGLPLELFTNGLAGALFRLGWATRRQANLLYIPLDTLCSALVFWAADLLMPQVEANALAILVTGLLSALCSQPIEKARQRKRLWVGTVN